VSQISNPVDIVRSLRTLTIVTGVVAIIMGVAILLWPLRSAATITLFIAIYTLIAGVIDIVLAIVSKGLGTWLRIGTAVLGVLFIAASIVAFVNLESTTVLLAVFVAVMLGVSWIFDGILTLFALPRRDGITQAVPPSSKGWTIAYAILSIVAGVIVLFSPLLTAVWLWLLIGVSLVVFGIVQIVRGVKLGR
jgi:uncharacterized membrane protein HdeD (DUF308 family)